jgi:hypothetical protein
MTLTSTPRQRARPDDDRRRAAVELAADPGQRLARRACMARREHVAEQRRAEARDQIRGAGRPGLPDRAAVHPQHEGRVRQKARAVPPLCLAHSACYLQCSPETWMTVALEV